MPSSAFKFLTGRQLAVAVAGFVFASVVSPAVRAATVAFNDFGPNFSYNSSSGDSINSGFTQGSQFQSSATGMLTDFEAALIYFNSQPPNTSFTLSLYTENSGTLGNLLAASGGSAGPASAGSVEHVQFALGVNLVADNKYWLIASSPNNDAWGFNNQGVLGVNYYTRLYGIDAVQSGQHFVGL